MGFDRFMIHVELVRVADPHSAAAVTPLLCFLQGFLASFETHFAHLMHY